MLEANMEIGTPFEPWAHLTFYPSTTSDNPPEPTLPTSKESLACRIRALKAFWRDALVTSVSQAPTNMLAKGVARERAANQQHRSSAALDILPLETLLQIETYLDIRSLIALSHTSSNLFLSIQAESTAKYLTQALTPISGAGELAALYLLASLNVADPTKRACVVCLVRHPLDAFHPWVAAHHVTMRLCTTYLRAFHRTRGVLEKWGGGRCGLCQSYWRTWASGRLSGPLESPAPILTQYVPGCPYAWELANKWLLWLRMEARLDSWRERKAREAVA
jgi:hypothetical protein